VAYFLDVVRARIAPILDITPEVLTHWNAIDLATGGLLPFWEHVWSRAQDRRTLLPYLTLALEILNNVDLPCSGMTSPWDFGAGVEDEQDGLLDAPWRGTGLHGDALPLLAALDQVSAGLAHMSIGMSLSRGGEQADDGATHVRPPRLQQRADALRQAAGGTGSPALLALVIPPRGAEILDVVGAHPLLSAADIACCRRRTLPASAR